MELLMTEPVLWALTDEERAELMATRKRPGNPRNLRNQDIGRERGRAKRIESARRKALDLKPVIAELQANGASSLQAIAAGLNERGIPTPQGGHWRAVQVKRVLERP